MSNKAKWIVTLNNGTPHDYCSALRKAVSTKTLEEMRDHILKSYSQFDEHEHGGIATVIVSNVIDLAHVLSSCAPYDPCLSVEIATNEGKASASLDSQYSMCRIEVARTSIDRRVLDAADNAVKLLQQALVGTESQDSED